MELLKIKKATARAAFNAGYDIVLLHSKLDTSAVFFHGERIAAGFINFDEAVNNFESYNCYSEIGLTARFYMFASDLIEFDCARYSKR